jgi:hypothetical protein
MPRDLAKFGQDRALFTSAAKIYCHLVQVTEIHGNLRLSAPLRRFLTLTDIRMGDETGWRKILETLMNKAR